MNETIHNQDHSRIHVGSGLLLLLAGILGIAFGGYGILDLLQTGGNAFSQGTDLIWGLPVVAYAYLALASFGIAIAATLAIIFRLEHADKLIQRALVLAFGLSIGALLALILELGRPFLALWSVPLSLQVRSPLLWMGVFWSFYLLFLTLALLRLALGESLSAKPLRLLAKIILFLAIGGIVTQGLVYGMMIMRPFWYGAVTPLYFLLGSVLSGLAFILLFTHLAGIFRRENLTPQAQQFVHETLPLLLQAVLLVYAVAIVARLVTGFWSVADGVQIVYQTLLTSRLFWIELSMSLLLPLLLLSIPALRRYVAAQSLAAISLIIGLFIARYEFLISGQMVPLFKGAWISGLDVSGFVPYIPNYTEWMVVLLATSTGIFLYALFELVIRYMATAKTTGSAKLSF